MTRMDGELQKKTISYHRSDDMTPQTMVKKTFNHSNCQNSNSATMLHPERRLKYVVIVFFIISVSVCAAQSVLRALPLSSKLFSSPILVYTSMIIPIILLTRATMTFLRHTQKFRYSMYSFLRDACVISILMNSQLHASVQKFGLERLKPVVTITLVTIILGYEMMQHDSPDSLCIATMMTMIAAAFLSASFVFNDTRWISISR